MTGVVVTQIVWSEVMMSTYADKVCGIQIVLSDGDSAYTYIVHKGEATLLGEGDHHLEKFDDYALELELTPMNLFANSSASYTMTVYPTEELYEVYSTRNPAMASMGAVVTIVFTSVLFLLYDLFVRREFNAKQQLLEAKRKFVRFVSHEVRTPLNSVCMGIALLKDEMAASQASSSGSSGGARTEHDIQQWLSLTDEVLGGARSAVDVLNDFLNYDKIESGKLTLELSVIRIFELVEKTFDEFKLPAEKGKLQCTIKTPVSKDGSNERFAVGDAIRLAQVFRNLLSNAIKFTPEGGKIEVLASWIPPSKDEEAHNQHTGFTLKNDEEITVTQSGSLIFSVRDSGAGMTDEQVQQVFCQGTQFNANTLQGGNGSGLGTWIAKGIVRQHAGILSATSEGIGKGSTFSVGLPVYEVSQDCKHSPTNLKTSQIKSEEGLQSLRILVVDDARMNLKLLMRLLTKKGHTCEGAEDGIIAVEKVKASMKQDHSFDVILMDFQMPNMDGPTATKTIRDLGSDAFIVGVTGNVMPEDVRHFKMHGANHVLPKPINIPDLEALFVEYDICEQGELSRPMIDFDMSEKDNGKDTDSNNWSIGRVSRISMAGTPEEIV
jgi:signal transduction histidine kinase/CheY-like chemotaxis protein